MGQPKFIVTGAGPGLLEYGPDHFALLIFKNSTFFETNVQITINSAPNTQTFKTYLHSIQNTSDIFHKNGFCWHRDSAQDLGFKELDWGKHNSCGCLDWHGYLR